MNQRKNQIYKTLLKLSNTFNQGKSIFGSGNKKPKTPYRKHRQKVLVRIEKEKDEDIKGNKKKEILSK